LERYETTPRLLVDEPFGPKAAEAAVSEFLEEEEGEEPMGGGGRGTAPRVPVAGGGVVCHGAALVGGVIVATEAEPTELVPVKKRIVLMSGESEYTGGECEVEEPEVLEGVS
jgi:hypothetical protein